MRIYVETSIPSFYFDTRPGAKMKARREWTREWWAKATAARLELVTGFSVFAELAPCPSPKREQALALLKALPVLEAVEEIQDIVAFYQSHRVMPGGAVGDAMHLALASFHGCGQLVTWNCRHLANAHKFGHIRFVNGLLGLDTPALVTLLELLEETP